MNLPLIDGFCRGLLDARPDETTDEARERFRRETAELDAIAESVAEDEV